MEDFALNPLLQYMNKIIEKGEPPQTEKDEVENTSQKVKDS